MDLGNKLGNIPEYFWMIFLLAFVFGYFYNQLVAWMERKSYMEGYLSFIVAAGVALTLIFVAIVDLFAALLCLAFFIATGLPMIIGSVQRYVITRSKDKQDVIQEGLKHD